MEDSTTQLPQDPASTDGQKKQEIADGGLIVVMTDSYGTTDNSDDTPEANQDTLA